MIRLRTFGGLAVESQRGVPVGTTAYRRRIALLPLLAVAGRHGLSREKIVSYLWPEADAERARNALAQTLYVLRRDLEEEALFLGSAELRLNPEVIATDVEEFESALGRGDPRRAVEVYRGPFLDGFNVSGAPDLERWADAERERFARRAAAALESLALEANRRRDYRAAVEWWRQLAALDPLNSRIALGLMTALAASGDRAGALQYARVHEALLREEVGAAPEAAVSALAERLRAEPTAEEAEAVMSAATSVGSETARANGAPVAPGPTSAMVRARPAAVYRDFLQRALAGRYEVARKLARSGMATVYLAHHLPEGHSVTLRVIDPGLAASMDVERFLTELRTVRKLAHPSLLPLIDADELQGVVFYVTAFLDAETLRDRLGRERQLPIGDALQISRELADALAFAHEQGTIHRDLKPKHVTLTGDGARLANVGVAQAVATAAGDALMRSGVLLGTPAYMSPEQAAGDVMIDGRSDLYSLGCMLYEMLVGEPPFAASSGQVTIARRWSERVPPIRTVRESVPKRIEDAVLTALARVPADRFRTVAEFRDAMALA